MTTTKMPPVHPGEILMEEFMAPLAITQYRLSKDIGVHPRRINQIVHGDRAVTADTALRLSRYFGTSESFWMNLQSRYDLEIEKDRLGDRLLTEVKELERGVVDAPASPSSS
jgi:addiction module HigA family antidote